MRLVTIATHSEAYFPYLKQSQGCVLNIGSINAYSGESSLLAYSIGKAGLQTMTRNLANAHGVDGVRFNLINPGWILTDREYVDQVKKGMPEGWPQKLGRDNIPFGVMSTPEQLAAACIYWIGDESKPFTAKQYCLDNGIELFFHERQHPYSSSKLRQRVYEAEVQRLKKLNMEYDECQK